MRGRPRIGENQDKAASKPLRAAGVNAASHYQQQHPMPLPTPPTRRPNNPASRQADDKASNELLFKGILCALIGVAVLVSPYFITSPGMQGIVAKASLVGWFALVLGGAFIGLYVWRRMAAPTKP